MKASSSFIERVVNDVTPLEAGAAGDLAVDSLTGRLSTAGTDAAGLAFDATGTTLYVTDTKNAIVKKVACT